jgi:hypothetical protein
MLNQKIRMIVQVQDTMNQRARRWVKILKWFQLEEDLEIKVITTVQAQDTTKKIPML